MSALPEPATIGAALVRTAAARPGDLALVLPPHRLTYADLLGRGEAAARRLAARGVTAGDHVGLLMPNCVELVANLFGIALLGAVAVPVNVRLRTADLGHVVRHSRMVALLTVPPLDGEPDLVALAGGVCGGATGPALLIAGQEAAAGPVPYAPGDPAAPAWLLYTSGTTAAPKGCVISHAAIVRTGTARLVERWDTPDTAVWNPCPLFHVGALVPLVGCVATGTPFVTQRRFDAGTALALLAAERVTTALPLFPAFTDAPLDHPAFAATDLAAVRHLFATGPATGVARAVRALPRARLISGYGMTELCGVAASSALADTAAERQVWDGQPFDGIEIEIRNPADGRAVPHGAAGEIVARGYCLFDHYLDDPEATAAAFDADGWFHTGDIGIRDELGHVAFLGRYKDMLKVGGENVSAYEVERFLGTHPAVRRAEVVGAPDPRLEEVVAAFVELEPGAVADAAELIAFCDGRIARFKVPRHVVLVSEDEWPMSATKVDKVALRARISEIVDKGGLMEEAR